MVLLLLRVHLFWELGAVYFYATAQSTSRQQARLNARARARVLGLLINYERSIIWIQPNNTFIVDICITWRAQSRVCDMMDQWRACLIPFTCHIFLCCWLLGWLNVCIYTYICIVYTIYIPCCRHALVRYFMRWSTKHTRSFITYARQTTEYKKNTKTPLDSLYKTAGMDGFTSVARARAFTHKSLSPFIQSRSAMPPSSWS